jgi:hypothetical protein
MDARVIECIGKLLYPSIPDSHDVVHEPDLIGIKRLFQPAHLIDDVLRTADVVALTPDRFGTPVAVERAAACGDQIH